MDVSEERREEAVKRLKAKRELRTHVVAYIVVNAMLVGIWALSGVGHFWPIWVMLGWGVGLVLNVWEVYGNKPITDEEIERELQRHR